jgi:ectoine hydroxylase-related dioxygenase (phytanoyl-CoA dioxygenase family)
MRNENSEGSISAVNFSSNYYSACWDYIKTATRCLCYILKMGLELQKEVSPPLTHLVNAPIHRDTPYDGARRERMVAHLLPLFPFPKEDPLRPKFSAFFCPG